MLTQELINKIQHAYMLIYAFRNGNGVDPEKLKQTLTEAIKEIQGIFKISFFTNVENLSLSELIIYFDFLVHRLHSLTGLSIH